MTRKTQENEEFIYKEDIKKKMGIKSNVAWNNRRPALIKAGMFRLGNQWIMRRIDWDLYIESLAKKAKVGPQVKKHDTPVD